MTAEQQKLIHLISDRLQPLLVNVPVCLKIPVNISSIQTVLIREYLMDQLHNLVLCKLDPSPANVSEAIVVAMQNLMEDNQFPMLYRMLLLVFTLSLSLLCILLAAVVLPGVYKVRGKIK